jgi:hypothetical protein
VTIAFDVLTMGRIGVDLRPLQAEVSLAAVHRQVPGGQPGHRRGSPRPGTGAAPQ